jgi:hypothetical protein
MDMTYTDVSTAVWSECIRLEFVYYIVYSLLYVIFIYDITCVAIQSGMRRTKSAVQYLCIGRYLHTDLIYTENCGALLEY